MQIANHITSTTTQVSGAITIGSALTSKTAEYVTSSGEVTQEAAQKAAEVIVSADQLALYSFLVMLATAIWNIYSSQRKHKLDQKALELRERELMLEKQKLNQSE